MTVTLNRGDEIVFRAQGMKQTNVVTVKHGKHPSILWITVETPDGKEIDSTHVELEPFNGREPE